MSELPSDAISVTRYGDLRRYLSAFAAGQLTLLILLGRQGIGKTAAVRSSLGLACGDETDVQPNGANHPLYVAGHASAFSLYQRLWEHRDAPVVIDDLDRLYAQPDCIRLLKQLCDGGTIKRISWSTRAADRTEGLPQQFETCSGVALIGNSWRTLNADVRALEDRAILLNFEPSNRELHDAVGGWFEDTEVHDFIGSVIADVPQLSIRHYLKGRALRAAGFQDWQATLMQMLLVDPNLACVARLQRDDSFPLEEDRVQAFVRETGRSRATFFRLKRQLKPALGNGTTGGPGDTIAGT